jgi:hypothetical protein
MNKLKNKKYLPHIKEILWSSGVTSIGIDLLISSIPLTFAKIVILQMQHHTLRITLSVLLTGAAFVFFAQLMVLSLNEDQRFFLIVQALLFLFLSSANYTDRKKALLGKPKTHLVILIVLAVVLSINGYFLVKKGNRDLATSPLVHKNNTL